MSPPSRTAQGNRVKKLLIRTGAAEKAVERKGFSLLFPLILSNDRTAG